jgi:hypothetical protein
MHHQDHHDKLKPGSPLFDRKARAKQTGRRPWPVKRSHAEKLAARPRPTPTRKSLRHPARIALGNAIIERDALKKEMAATEKAGESCHRKVREAEAAVERANERIEEAKREAARHLVETEMGRAGKAPKSIAEARQQLAAAEDALEVAMAAQASVTARRKGVNGSGLVNRLAIAEMHVGQLVADVVKHDPAVTTIMSHWDELQLRYLSLLKLLHSLSVAGMLPAEHRGIATLRDDSELDDYQSFKAAIAALKNDADTPLPSLLPKPPNGHDA